MNEKYFISINVEFRFNEPFRNIDIGFTNQEVPIIEGKVSEKETKLVWVAGFEKSA